MAVMDCIVHGAGESKHADIGISLPGTGETPAAPVFIDGEKAATLRGENIAEDFKVMVSDYIETSDGVELSSDGWIGTEPVSEMAALWKKKHK